MVLIYIYMGVLVYWPLSVMDVLVFVCVYVCICACGIKSETKKGLGDIGGILKQRGLGTLCQLYVVWNNS